MAPSDGKAATEAKKAGGEVVALPGGKDARVAPPARVRPRHRAAIAGFLAVVLAPAVACGVYMYAMAADQYASTVAFSVRNSEASAPVEFLGALTQGFGGGGGVDAEVVYEFIRSQQMVEAALTALPLREIYNTAPDDPLFRLGEEQAVEDVHDYWRWMTTASLDGGAGIINFTARAFEPDDARAIATFVLDEATRVVNDLSRRARDDAVQLARESLTEAEDRLRAVRLEIRGFRAAEQEVDPAQNARAALDMITGFEEKLAEARIALETQTELVGARSPQIPVLRQRIESLRRQIAEERARIGQVAPDAAGARAMADVLAEYEDLVVDREFAEKAYLSALSAYEQAQIEARRQLRYLAPHIQPTLAEAPRYPQRLLITFAVTAGLAVLWAVGVLIAYNIRDRR